MSKADFWFLDNLIVCSNFRLREMMQKDFYIFIGAVFVILFFPLIFLWSINTVFGLEQPYNLSRWFAAFLLLCFLPATRK